MAHGLSSVARTRSAKEQSILDIVDEFSSKGIMPMLMLKSPEAVASAVKQYMTKKYQVKQIYADAEIALRMQTKLPMVKGRE